MVTTIVKTIGGAGTITPDYSTLALWMAGCPADLTSNTPNVGGSIWEGQVLNQGELVIAAGVILTVSGTVTSATCNILLHCYAGASFRDNANVRTNALFYNTSNGVAIRGTANYVVGIQINLPNVTLAGLQVRQTGNGNNQVITWGGTADNIVIDGCLAQKTTTSSSSVIGAAVTTCGGIIKNSLAIWTGTGSGFSVYGRSSPSALMPCYGCTSIGLSGQGANYQLDNYGNARLVDCAGFGAANFKAGNATASSAGNNATDQATAYGSSNQTSLTFSSQFISTTNDFRAASGGALPNNGATNSNILVDISNTTRSLTTPTIGCWEVTGGAASQIFMEWLPKYGS